MHRFAASFVMLVACGSEGSAPVDSAPTIDSAPVDKAANCASTFGSALTNAFGRVDGTIVAVVPPAHPTCAAPNNDHLVIQVSFGGAVHRMVVNVESIFVDEVDAAFAGPTWSEGWHTGVAFDYVNTLHEPSIDFQQKTMAEAVELITDQLEIGAKISVFGSSSGGTYASSAHLIHRNDPNEDGAIVINPDTNPHYVLMKFSNQTF
ncbi:MAG: hypothetical protein SFX73_35520 [Kofleriaceae bacterium]|nr:hypothetical protein [Kofleriaceae bacterium]